MGEVKVPAVTVDYDNTSKISQHILGFLHLGARLACINFRFYYEFLRPGLPYVRRGSFRVVADVCHRSLLHLLHPLLVQVLVYSHRVDLRQFPYVLLSVVVGS